MLGQVSRASLNPNLAQLLFLFLNCFPCCLALIASSSETLKTYILLDKKWRARISWVVETWGVRKKKKSFVLKLEMHVYRCPKLVASKNLPMQLSWNFTILIFNVWPTCALYLKCIHALSIDSFLHNKAPS